MKLLAPITFWSSTIGLLMGALLTLTVFQRIPVWVTLPLYGVGLFMTYAIGNLEKKLRGVL